MKKIILLAFVLVLGAPEIPTAEAALSQVTITARRGPVRRGPVRRRKGPIRKALSRILGR